MFDAKKLLDALGTPATPPAPAPTAPAPAPAPEATKPAEAKPASAAQAFGAGTLLSELIGIANRPSPPAPDAPAQAASAEGEQPPPPPKPAAPKAPAPPADLTDLLLGKAQEFLKTPQGNAAMNAVVLGLTKAVVNSEAGRKLTAQAKSKGTALFNRFLNKGAEAPVIEGSAIPVASGPEPAALPAPAAEAAGSGDTALLVMRAMIAAAAADGRIDQDERERILGTLTRAGIDGEGVKVIEAELDRPASATDLAAAVRTPEQAVQVYTAARRIITPNTVEERVFLAHLSAALGLDPKVVAQIDALASGAIKA
ncbi:tellurite resistance TerB family protein [Microvirga subterranea]|uniref:Uncharacterized membrane protein YebE (DUF533 family) n=1 Tax=Microvirga subterranea TaxID=186651 RepID=A0A370HW36_9HYPH|nr:DUF533 domain-containing protein [Microvirga subterranea]RDI62510.1 uncharacterized membrane protein YebE (DUF533 family) [Microvirga subterranea]